MERKHLSSIANDILRRSAQTLDGSVESLVEAFEKEWKPEMGGYSRKLVEFCCAKALTVVCGAINENIGDGSFGRFTFDMMLAWETPTSQEEESYSECMAKEREEKKGPPLTIEGQDDIPLFYSDLMPLLVDTEPSVGEDAFVWLGTLVPLVVDIVNGRFTFETLTAPTGNRLHFPAYDKFLKEIHKCMEHLQKQDVPTGIELLDDEFILHVEGTASTQRIVRHIGGTSWPGRLTLTNYALYFEATSSVSYENAIKLDLSSNIQQTLKPVATGPWGAPLFDKAIAYESSELQDSVILEFPEMTSSTRRDHWLALLKEIMLLHQFLLNFSIESPLEAWEMHARTIVGIIRLHAARELLRISPPQPNSFLIFALLDELPKGDHILQQLAESLKTVTSGHPCSASSILRNLNVSQTCVLSTGTQSISDTSETVQPDNLVSLETTIHQAREEAKELGIAKATTEGLKEEGISDSVQVLMGLLNPVKNAAVPRLLGILTWEQPMITSLSIVISLVVVYKEWVGLAISAFMLWAVAKIRRLRQTHSQDKQNKIVILTGSDQTTMESIVSAQQGLRSVHEIIQHTNITLLKIWSILISRAPKHTNTVVVITTLSAALIALMPFKFILMSLILYGFIMTSKLSERFQSDQGNRRLQEWWDSIPIIPVEVVDKESDSSHVVGVER